MSGLEGPALSAAVALAKRFARTTEFERLCSGLAERFGEQTGYGPSNFTAWADDDAFMVALGGYLRPPHDFDRAALIAAITPLVGPLDEQTPAEVFAAMVADAIRAEVRIAKTGDDLQRFEADRIIEVVKTSATAGPVGGIDVKWAPWRAQRWLRRLAEVDVAGARNLQRALENRDLRLELSNLVQDPPGWLREAGPEAWQTVAYLSEVVGCWPQAVAAYEEVAERPGADRVRAWMGASGAASYAGDSETSKVMRERARAANLAHPIVVLVDVAHERDPELRLSLLEGLGEPTDLDDRALVLATRAIALVDCDRLDEAGIASDEALSQAPELTPVREAPLVVLLARNRKLRRAGNATERNALLRGAEEYRRMRDDLRESRRYQESGWSLQRAAELQNLADRSDLALLTLAEIEEDELAVDDVSLGLAEAALNAGDPDFAEKMLEHYSGEDPAADLMRAHMALRDPTRRQEGVVILDRHVAEGSYEAAFIRLTAGVPPTGEVSWSDDAETIVREQEPALASFIKAEWHERAGRTKEAQRELSRHAGDPRALEELMVRFAEREEWAKATGPARALLASKPSLRARIKSAQVLRQAGAAVEAEVVLREVLGNPDALVDERRAAFDQLTNQLLLVGRLDEASAVAHQALADDLEEARWVIAYVLARKSKLKQARTQIEGLMPRGSGDATLGADLHFAVDPPGEALRNIVALADALSDTNEHVEARAALAFLRCTDGEITPELAARAGPEQFVARFPESKVLWKEEFADDEEGIELLRSHARARAEAAAEAERHVLEKGDWPVGALAGALGMSLAEIWTMLPKLPVAYDDDSLAEEVTAATDAAGGPVVVETGALHSLALLGVTISDVVPTEYPLSLTARATTEDLIRATTNDLTGSRNTLHQAAWDAANDDLVILEMPAEDAQAPRRRAQVMQQLAVGLTTPPEFSWVEASGDDSVEGSVIARIYTETVELARHAKCAIYSDDRLFRSLLSQEGISCFSTLALLHSLRDAGVLDDHGHADALSRLRERGALGLALTDDQEE
jgi:hypothetical protein